MFEKYQMTKEDIKLLNDLDNGIFPKWEEEALTKGAKFIKKDK